MADGLRLASETIGEKETLRPGFFGEGDGDLRGRPARGAAPVADRLARLLQRPPYSFDASIWEIFLPLATGSRLVLVTKLPPMPPSFDVTW